MEALIQHYHNLNVMRKSFVHILNQVTKNMWRSRMDSEVILKSVEEKTFWRICSLYSSG